MPNKCSQIQITGHVLPQVFVPAEIFAHIDKSSQSFGFENCLLPPPFILMPLKMVKSYKIYIVGQNSLEKEGNIIKMKGKINHG